MGHPCPTSMIFSGLVSKHEGMGFPWTSQHFWGATAIYSHLQPTSSLPDVSWLRRACPKTTGRCGWSRIPWSNFWGIRGGFPVKLWWICAKCQNLCKEGRNDQELGRYGEKHPVEMDNQSFSTVEVGIQLKIGEAIWANIKEATCHVPICKSPAWGENLGQLSKIRSKSW